MPQQSSTLFEQPMHMLQQPIQQNQSWSIGCQKSLCLHYGKPMQDSVLMFGTYAKELVLKQRHVLLYLFISASQNWKNFASIVGFQTMRILKQCQHWCVTWKDQWNIYAHNLSSKEQVK